MKHPSPSTFAGARADPGQLDDAFGALADPVRRWVLLVLAAGDRREAEPFHYPEDLPFDALDAETRRSLHHTHLPKLEAVGLIEWDVDDRAVTRGPRFGVVGPFLDVVGMGVDPSDDV